MRRLWLWPWATIVVLALFNIQQVLGYHNVTVLYNDGNITYQPLQVWKSWSGDCLKEGAGAVWTSDPWSNITFPFKGVAIYGFATFDDTVSNPIYTVDIDGNNSTWGYTTQTQEQRCQPIFQKTGLQFSNHTLVLILTDIRPNDVKDMAFNGFVYTVADPGDPEYEAAAANEDDKKDGKGKPGIAVIAGAAAGGGVLLILVAVAVFLLVRRRRRRPPPAQQLLPNAGYNPTIPPGGGIPQTAQFAGQPHYPVSAPPWTPVGGAHGSPVSPYSARPDTGQQSFHSASSANPLLQRQTTAHYQQHHQQQQSPYFAANTLSPPPNQSLELGSQASPVHSVSSAAPWQSQAPWGAHQQQGQQQASLSRAPTAAAVPGGALSAPDVDLIVQRVTAAMRQEQQQQGHSKKSGEVVLRPPGDRASYGDEPPPPVYQAL